MTGFVELLGTLGIALPTTDDQGSMAARVRAFFGSVAAEGETDADGSQRLLLAARHDQLVLTSHDEVVLVHDQSDRNEFDAATNTVLAKTTAKAANELTKLRFWRAVQDGLKHVRAIGVPDKPDTLEQWMQQTEEQASKLRRQAAILGLAAENTHQFSALLFEPALVEGSWERSGALRRAVALYYEAEALRALMAAETSRRLIQKPSPDPEARRSYFARRQQYFARAAKLYDKAAPLFAHCDAKILAQESAAAAEVCAESAAEPPSRERTLRVALPRSLEESRSRDRYEEARKLIDPTDQALSNTVRAINGLSDAERRENLKQWFANHLVDIARRLKTPQEVLRLLEKIQRLGEIATDDSCIRTADLQRYRQLVARTCAHLLARVGPRDGPDPSVPKGQP